TLPLFQQVPPLIGQIASQASEEGGRPRQRHGYWYTRGREGNCRLLRTRLQGRLDLSQAAFLSGEAVPLVAPTGFEPFGLPGARGPAAAATGAVLRPAPDRWRRGRARGGRARPARG